MRTLTVYLTCYLYLCALSAYGKIVFQSTRDGNSEIYVMSSFGNGQTRLTDYEESDGAAVWSPNGRQIAFDRAIYNRKGEVNYEVFVMDTDGSNQRNLTRHPASDALPDWSPDGSQIAFDSDRNGNLNVYVMDADGGNVRQITHTKFAGAPKWSPDGQHIAFEASLGLGQGRQVYVMNADGTNRGQVSEPIPNAVMFVEGWSPDGTQILYKASIHALVTHASVFIATLNASKRRVVKRERVPIPKMDSSATAWGADGKSILISLRKAKEEDWDIYRFHLPDGPLIQLTNHPASDLAPNEWNPRLSVSPQRLAPTRWGEIKSNSNRHWGIGSISITPVP